MKMHICMVLDRSGSMEKVKDDTIGGFNSFIKEQQLNTLKTLGKGNCCSCSCEDKITMTLIQFNDKISNTYNCVDINSVPYLEYSPNGMTALNDAINKGIKQTEMDISGKNIDKVLFVIMTDGQDNSSRMKIKDIAEKIGHYKSCHQWQFVFIGTEIDSFTEANNISIPHGWVYSSRYCRIPETWEILSKSVCNYYSSTDKTLNNFFTEG